MMKKFIIAVGIASLFGSVLVGCSGGSDEPVKGDNQAAKSNSKNAKEDGKAANKPQTQEQVTPSTGG